MKRIWVWLKSWFVTEIKETRPAKRKTQQKEHLGVHYYMGDLLGSLDDYFNVMALMKKIAPEEYNYFNKIGMPVADMKNMFFDIDYNPHMRKGEYPSYFGMHFNLGQIARRGGEVFYLDPETGEELIHPAIMTFQKVRYIPNVQFSNATIYKATTWLDDSHSKHNQIIGVPWHFAIDDDANIEILKEHVTSWQYPKKRKGKNWGKIPVQRWRAPRVLTFLQEDLERRSGEKLTLVELIERHFNVAHNLWMQSHAGLKIMVSKGDLKATFTIDMLRTPYFFKDRIKVKTESGRTKPIFHIVRTHQRKNQKDSFVRSHFRGLRKFEWEGYDVRIVLPSRSLFGMKFTSYFEDDPQCPDINDSMDLSEVGKTVGKFLEGGKKNEHLRDSK